MQVITSKDNETIKKIRKLKDKKYRDLENVYVVEGIRLVEEAINEKVNIKQIIVCDECKEAMQLAIDRKYEIAKYECIYVTKKIFSLLTDVISPQGMMAVIEKSKKSTEVDISKDIIIALDGIQDPGNLGTILRTIDSANLGQIIISKDTVDCYNPKVIRSTMGAIFRLNIIESSDLKETLLKLKKNKYKIMVTSLKATKTIYEEDFNKKIIVIGNEANGVSKQIIDISDTKVIIPMLGKTESLNASVACGVMIYEYVRRKFAK